MLSDVSNDFKSYHFAIVDQLNNDEEAVSKQQVLDDHELKVMELIDHFGELIGEPSQTSDGSDNDRVMIPQSSELNQATIKGRTVDRQVDIIDGSIAAIKGNLENPEAVDVYLLRGGDGSAKWGYSLIFIKIHLVKCRCGL